MKDIFGKQLAKGDKVVFVAHSTSCPALKTGIITSIAKSDKSCSVDLHPGVMSNRIAKLPITDIQKGE